MSDSLLVGIDVSATENKVRLLHPDGSSICKFSVKNNMPGAKSISDRITSTMSSLNFDSLKIGIEATSVYGEPLVYFLKQDTTLHSFNPRIHVLNARQVNNFKKSYPDLPMDYCRIFAFQSYQQGGIHG